MASIMLAEDDDTLRLFLYRALRKAGHAVTAVGQGDVALQHIRERSYDLLLTDVVMPVMDGVELARKAEVLHPKMKIMFITGFAAVVLNPNNETPSGAKVMSKPFHLKELVDEVECLLA